MPATVSRRSAAALAACAGLLGTGIVAACSSSSSPNASPQTTFVRAIRAEAGGRLIIAASDSQILALGQGVCTRLAAGAGPAKLDAEMLKGHDPTDFSSGDSAAVIGNAVMDLCPNLRPALSGWDGQPQLSGVPDTTTSTTPPPGATTTP
jgi:hypothetical protein